MTAHPLPTFEQYKAAGALLRRAIVLRWATVFGNHKAPQELRDQAWALWGRALDIRIEKHGPPVGFDFDHRDSRDKRAAYHTTLTEAEFAE